MGCSASCKSCSGPEEPAAVHIQQEDPADESDKDHPAELFKAYTRFTRFAQKLSSLMIFDEVLFGSPICNSDFTPQAPDVFHMFESMSESAGQSFSHTSVAE